MLALAFFIYGIFNPSWAARLWYNVRTFPQRMAGWMWSGKEFLDYNTYKSKISSIWENIWDTISDSIWDKINLGDDSEFDLGFDDELEGNVKSYDDNLEEKELAEMDEPDYKSGKQAIKAFPKSIKFIEIPQLKNDNKNESRSDNLWPLTWYSKTDLLWVINRYIEKNLDDDTDILVTVEYEDDSGDPKKIVLQTQSKSDYLIPNSGDLLDDIFENTHESNAENMVVSSSEKDESKEEKSDLTQKQSQSSKKTISTKLTQKEQKEAEEIFSILF